MDLAQGDTPNGAPGLDDDGLGDGSTTEADSSRRRRRGRLLTLLSTVGILWFVVFPIFWIGISAFKQPGDVREPSLIFTPTLRTFRVLFSEDFRFGDLLFNSFVICIAVVVITVPLAAMGAYSLSRFPLPAKRALLIMILATQFFPPVVLVLPYFNLFRELNLLDTYPALTLLNLTRTVPFSLWLLYGFIDSLPRDIEEAALVDGCSEFGILRRITGPLAMPGIVVTAIFSFILAWNELLYALLLTSNRTRTAIVGLINVVGERDVPWELMSGAGILVMVPMLIMAVGIRQYFVEGITMGATK